MARSPPCSEEVLNRGAWTTEEDRLLVEHVKRHGRGKWRKLAQDAGLKRSGKSCRLRWLNYLRPELKRGNISPDEEDLIIRLHRLLGNRWSLIAGRLPGRSDNEIKNYWNTTLKKKATSSSSYDNKDKNNNLVDSPSSSSERNNINNVMKTELVDNTSMNLFHETNATTSSPTELYKCEDLDQHDDINFGLEGLSFDHCTMILNDDINNNNNNDNVGEMNDYGTPSGSGTNCDGQNDNVLEKILMDLDGTDNIVSDSEFWLAINDWIGEDCKNT